MHTKTNDKTAKTREDGFVKLTDISAAMQKINEAMSVIEQYKAENPDVDVEAILTAQKVMYPLLGRISSRELDKFVSYAKEQGSKIPFDTIENGVLTAGRKDMQNGLSEILNSMKFAKPTCTECDEEMIDRGRSKKKFISSVGVIEINPVRHSCAVDIGQSVYPLLDFVGLIEHETTLKDGSTEIQTVKCTRNAAASIALACSESSYEQASLVLNRLSGIDVDVMTELRVTNSVGSEFVEDVPSGIDTNRIEEQAEKMGGNILNNRIEQMNDSDDKDEIVQKAVKDGPDGVMYKDYDGPTIKMMYVLPDGTGVPGRHQELAGSKGKQPDGSAKTFEAKIGAVFTTEYTTDGKPLLTESGEIYRSKNVSYMGTTRKVEDFGPMLYQHAVKNGLEDVDVVTFLGDGAKWIWGVQNTYFPNALTGVDLYHSTERVNGMIDLLQFKGRAGKDKKQEIKDECIELLRCGKVQNMLDLIETLPIKKGNESKLESAMGYFRSNIERMDYGTFTACGIFVGSGVIEAGCKLIVGNRMKNAGMHWTKAHAEKMINLRCAIRNGEFFDSYLNNSTSPEKSAA